MAIHLSYRGGTRFDLTDGAHVVVADQPVEDGGADAGMGPVGLFVSSLAGCVGYFIVRFCVRHGIPADGFTIEADWAMAEQPHRVGAIAIRLALPANLTAEQRIRLLKVAHGCTVHQSLVVPPKVEINLVSSTGRGTDDCDGAGLGRL